MGKGSGANRHSPTAPHTFTESATHFVENEAARLVDDVEGVQGHAGDGHKRDHSITMALAQRLAEFEGEVWRPVVSPPSSALISHPLCAD